MTAFLTFKAMEYTAQSVTDMGSLREDDVGGKSISILPNIENLPEKGPVRSP